MPAAATIRPAAAPRPSGAEINAAMTRPGSMAWAIDSAA